MANVNLKSDVQDDIQGTAIPEPLVAPVQITSTPTMDGSPAPTAHDELYPPEGPAPKGTTPGAMEEMKDGSGGHSENGVGIEGEEVVWQARYSLKNFIGRIAVRSLLTVAWVGLIVYTWDQRSDLWPLTTILGLGLGVYWALLLYRIAQAHFGHEYELTNRRLFVGTGLFRRRRDQMELIRVKDVFTRQSLIERWLGIGTVVVVSSEDVLPTQYILGVNDPKQVMDLVWHHARAERDLGAAKVDTV